MCHWELTQWEARPKLQVHKRSAMQLKTRLVRLPDDRLALALTGLGAWVQARSVQVRLRVRTQLGNWSRLATGELIDEISGLARAS